MANYRHLQADFSGGELDPMIEANITHPLRQIGIKKSINTYHLPNGAVQKRPPLKEAEQYFLKFDTCANVNIVVDGISYIVCFGYAIVNNQKAYAIFVYNINENNEPVFSTVISEGMTNGFEDSHFAVYKNTVVEANRNRRLAMYTFEGLATEHATVTRTEPELIGWKWGNPSSCMFASGRLFLSVGNTILASRTPEDGANRFFDFTLADYKYKWQMQRLHMDTAHCYDYERTFTIYLEGPAVSPANLELHDSNASWYEMRGQCWADWETPTSPLVPFYMVITTEYWNNNNFGNMSNHDRVQFLYNSEEFDYNALRSDNYEACYFGDLGWPQPVWDTATFVKVEVSKNSEYVTMTKQNDFIHTFAISQNKVDPTKQENQWYYLSIPSYSWNFYGFSNMTLSERIQKIVELHGSSGNVSMHDLFGDKHDWKYIPNELLSANGTQIDISVETETRFSNGQPLIRNVTSDEYNLMTGERKTRKQMPNVIDMEPLFNIANKDSKLIQESIEETPTILVSHAIEVHESDLESTEISWMANLGRIIVGTPQAIFMSTDDIITPQTFHLVPTSYVSCSRLQPRMLQSWIIFTSKDEKNIYLGMYNDQAKGLLVYNATTMAQHLFEAGIKQIEMTDYPYPTMFVVTNDNSLHVGVAKVIENNLQFAFSTWEIPYRSILFIAFHRKDKNNNQDTLIVGSFGPYTENPNIDVEATSIYYMKYEPISSIEAPRLFKNIYACLDHGTYVEMADPDNPILVLHGLSQSFGIDKRTKLVIITISDPTSPDCQISIMRDVDIPESLEIPLEKGTHAAYWGIPYTMDVQLMQQLLPNNIGVALRSNHSVERISLQLYKSTGGEIRYNGKKVKDLLQLMWGKNEYGKSLYKRVGNSGTNVVPVTFTDVYSINNPTQQTMKDELEIVSDEIYPFNLLAVEMKYNVTEVN